MKLNEEQIQDALSHIADWGREGDWLTRDLKFDNFKGAMEFVNRVAGFVPSSMRELKQLTNAITLPADDAFEPEARAFFNGLGRPEVQNWAKHAFERGLQQPGRVEENLADMAFPFVP